MPTGHEGTGKHGHKDSEEPWPHTKDNRSASGRDDSSGSRDGRSDGRSDGGSQASSREEQESLKEREYRDDQGQVHHHTRKYEEQHKDQRR